MFMLDIKKIHVSRKPFFFTYQVDQFFYTYMRQKQFFQIFILQKIY